VSLDEIAEIALVRRIQDGMVADPKRASRVKEIEFERALCI